MSLTMNLNNAFVKQQHNTFLPDPPKSQSSRNLLSNNNNNDKTNRKVMQESTATDNNNTSKMLERWTPENFTQSDLKRTNEYAGKVTSWATADEWQKKLPKLKNDISDFVAKQLIKSEKLNDVKIKEEVDDDDGGGSVQVVNNVDEEPAHHARRPMNAFLIFCKKHRSIVREKYPSLENRSVTKILGEWWAVLDETEKRPFTALAKEHKDAFLSAHPTFKWYKLPAPPLRACVRPTTNNNNVATKIQTPLSSPTPNSVQTTNFQSQLNINNNNNNHVESVFTPGKLADESQLGSLSSLLNNNFTSSTIINKTNENNNNNDIKADLDVNDDEVCEDDDNTSVNLPTTLPRRPFKKRPLECCAEDELVDDDNNEDMTTQDLVDIVIDSTFTDKDLVRKSGRKGKGNRYEQFMVEGRLLGNKRETPKLTSSARNINNNNIDERVNNETDAHNLDLTIKRLAERTNKKNFLIETNNNENNKEDVVAAILPAAPQQETNEKSPLIPSPNSINFNLNLRIDNLPCLSYDVYMQRKKDGKKRKGRSRTDSDCKNNNTKKPKLAIKNETQLVGSKKRKNKQSITHLEKKDEVSSTPVVVAAASSSTNDALMTLATLAEVAANVEKITTV